MLRNLSGGGGGGGGDEVADGRTVGNMNGERGNIEILIREGEGYIHTLVKGVRAYVYLRGRAFGSWGWMGVALSHSP